MAMIYVPLFIKLVLTWMYLRGFFALNTASTLKRFWLSCMLIMNYQRLFFCYFIRAWDLEYCELDIPFRLIPFFLTLNVLNRRVFWISILWESLTIVLGGSSYLWEPTFTLNYLRLLSTFDSKSVNSCYAGGLEGMLSWMKNYCSFYLSPSRENFSGFEWSDLSSTMSLISRFANVILRWFIS